MKRTIVVFFIVLVSASIASADVNWTGLGVGDDWGTDDNWDFAPVGTEWYYIDNTDTKGVPLFNSTVPLPGVWGVSLGNIAGSTAEMTVENNTGGAGIGNDPLWTHTFQMGMAANTTTTINVNDFIPIGAKLINPGANIEVGKQGAGSTATMNIGSSGNVNNSGRWLLVGIGTGTTGTLNVDGGVMSAPARAWFGGNWTTEAGIGNLNVTNGGHFDCGIGVWFGTGGPGSYSTVNVTGAGSRVFLWGTSTFGGTHGALLNVTDGAQYLSGMYMGDKAYHLFVGAGVGAGDATTINISGGSYVGITNPAAFEGQFEKLDWSTLLLTNGEVNISDTSELSVRDMPQITATGVIRLLHGTAKLRVMDFIGSDEVTTLQGLITAGNITGPGGTTNPADFTFTHVPADTEIYAYNSWVLTAVPVCQNDPFADADGDSDVDQDDFAKFQLCYTGGSGGVPDGCVCFDQDEDDDIDDDDFTAFQNCASGPYVPANTACDD